MTLTLEQKVRETLEIIKNGSHFKDEATTAILALLQDEVKELVEALEEIKKGEGAYSQDHLTHANNTIENMKSIAEEALSNWRSKP